MRKSLTIISLMLFMVAAGHMARAADYGGAEIACRYVENGADGTDGNVLSVSMKKDGFNHSLYIGQTGQEIEVGSLEDYNIGEWPSGGLGPDIVDCSGPTPTVRNIDRIVINALPQANLSLALDGRDAGPDGLLAPGATPEEHGSDIEIRAVGQLRTFRTGSELLLVGGKGDESFGLGSKLERAGVNLNVTEDGGFPDADLLPNLQFGSVTVDLGPGSDRLYAGGEKTGLGRFDAFVDLLGFGGPGKDRMFGHDGLDLMTGGKGNDVVRGGAGGDSQGYAEFGLTGGPGNDRVYGGPGDDTLGGVDNATGDFGSDYLSGGPGRDRFIQPNDRDRDVIDCGGDRTGRLDREKKFDQLRHCGNRS